MSYFKDQAKLYAEFRPDYPRELFEFLAAQVPQHALAWDCATGSGQAALGLAAHFDRVIATDASPDQLAHARPHPKIEYRVAAADATGLPAATVNAIAVTQALHWFNAEKFYQEVRRVAAPGAVLLVTVYNDVYLDDAALSAILWNFGHHIVGPYWPAERKLLDNGYRDIPFPFEEIPAPALPLERQWNLHELAGYVRSWSATVRYIKALGADPVRQLGTDLAAKGWSDPKEKRRVRWDFTIKAGRVKKV